MDSLIYCRDKTHGDPGKKKKTKQNHQDLMADSGDIQTDCVIKTRGIENTHVSLACRLHV